MNQNVRSEASGHPEGQGYLDKEQVMDVFYNSGVSLQETELIESQC